MFFNQAIQLDRLTEEKAKELCDIVFPAEVNETLEITLGNSNKVPFWKQFYYRYGDRLLKYNQDKTIGLMAMTYQNSKQDILKLKLFKQKEGELNNPEAFSLTRINSSINNSNVGNMNTETMTGGRGDKGLLVANNDVLNSDVSKSLDRGATSALHEDYREIDKSWERSDTVMDPEQAIAMPDVKLPTEDSKINLDELKVGVIRSTDIRQRQQPAPTLPEGQREEFADVIYTDVTVGKGIVKSNSSSFTAGKTLNNSKVDVTVSKNIMTTSLTGSEARTLSLEFTKNDATYQALSLYASNFRESFLNSFNHLFLEIWNGY